MDETLDTAVLTRIAAEVAADMRAALSEAAQESRQLNVEEEARANAIVIEMLAPRKLSKGKACPVCQR